MTDSHRLDALRHALLALHKTLLDAQRIRYEREHGRIESRGELLDLVLRDPSFEWLRVLSALIAGLDELAEADEDASGVIDKLRTLVRFEGNPGFTGPYREIIEAVPDALVAHVQLSRLLADFGAAGRAAQARRSGGGEPVCAGRSVPLGAARGHEGRALAPRPDQRGAQFRAPLHPCQEH